MNDIYKTQNTSSRTLTLTIKRKWFDMIKSGEKKEEYRERKLYWHNRLWQDGKLKEFDRVLFINGYRPESERLLVECTGIGLGVGHPDWGAVEGETYYIIQLGIQLPTPQG